MGTKDAEGVKEVLVGTKSLDDALKGLLESLDVDWNGCGETVRGLGGSLHVETSVELTVECADFRSENCD